MAATKINKETEVTSLARVRFVEKEAGDEKVLLRFEDPTPLVAAVRVGTPELTGTVETASADLAVLMIATEIADRKQWREKVREWLKAQGGPPAARIALEDNAFVFFRAGQAVIVAPAEDMDGLLEAVVEFTFYEKQLRLLESDAAANWGMAEQHVALIHTVAEKDLKKKEVLDCIQAAMLRRMRYARLEPHLTLTPDRFKGTPREAARRLRERSSMETRLEAIDGQVEVFEDIYDMANSRRGEYDNFLRSYRVEIMILMVLVLELIMIAWDIYLSHYSGE